MKKNKIIKIVFIFLILISIFLIYLKFLKNDPDSVQNETVIVEENVYSSNVIENVNYSTKDKHGNEYLITALTGEIDYANPNIIYLTNVKQK